MMLRQCFWAAASAVVLAHASGASANAQTRRALLIGIDEYQQPEAQLAVWRKAAAPQIAAWRSRLGSAPGGRPAPMPLVDDVRSTVQALDGAVNDAQAMAAMLRTKYGFTDVHLLTNAQATRAGILAALERLVTVTDSGDVVAVYYAGHGSQRVNSLAITKLNRLDQTIVPVDANAGQFDIRNTELAAIFNRILDRHAALTLIFDSCHSGAITRGETVPGKKRWVAADPRDARDSVRPTPPEDRPRGALFLAAAEDFQSAQETFDETDQRHHGAFTSALLQVMRRVPANAPAAQVFARTRAILQQDDLVQNPVLRGLGSDHSRPLFGIVTASVSESGVTLAVQRVEEDTVRLQGGAELGFGRGTELRLGDSTRGRSVRLRVTDIPGFGSSKAVAMEGSAAALRSGDLMVLDRWVDADRPAMRAWIPAPLAAPALGSAAAQLGALRKSVAVEWVDDPSTLPDDGRPLYVIRYERSGWKLQTPAGELTRLAVTTTASVEEGIARQEVAAAKRAADEARGLGQSPPSSRGRARVFVVLPPTPELRRLLQIGTGTRNDAILVQPELPGTDYMLVGQDSAGRVAYAWLRPNIRAMAAERSSLPVRTDWYPVGPGEDTAVAHLLEAKVVALARIKRWLTIESPESENQFPYRLFLRNIATGEVKDSGVTRGGERYDILLRRNSTVDARRIRPRWVYIFAIDSWGAGTLLWSYDNTIPFDSAGTRVAPLEITLKPNGDALAGDYIPIGEPYGTDTFILISSAQQLDPLTFALTATRTRGGHTQPGQGRTPLDQLFERLGGSTRGVPSPVPITWSIQRVALRSVPGGETIAR